MKVDHIKDNLPLRSRKGNGTSLQTGSTLRFFKSSKTGPFFQCPPHSVSRFSTSHDLWTLNIFSCQGRELHREFRRCLDLVFLCFFSRVPQEQTMEFHVLADYRQEAKPSLSITNASLGPILGSSFTQHIHASVSQRTGNCKGQNLFPF